jgi:hypothetical protein
MRTITTITSIVPGGRFPLGECYGTPAALDAIRENKADYADYLRRHGSRDWGNMCGEDVEVNERFLSIGANAMKEPRAILFRWSSSACLSAA